MCGVFGFVGKNGQTVDLKRLRDVATVTNRRGNHAWGLAWIDTRGRLCSFRQQGAIVDSLPLLSMARDAVALIGHCRWATQGDPADNVNNHPHPADGGWIVHNGVIPGYRRLLTLHGLSPVSACDSEVLALLMERLDGDDLVERAVNATDAVLSQGRAPLVLLGLWKPGQVVAVRRGNPLVTSSSRRSVWMASLPEGLPGKPRQVPDQHALTFTAS
jgi:glucosamine 6-phosphate synthetase-like amidotransferase/phosphosugar isomerase protein